jgi:hypothetical protein
VRKFLLYALVTQSGSAVRKQVKNTQRGFTLIELLVTMLLSSGIILIVSNLYLSIFTSQRTQFEKSAMYENANTALNTIGKNIELAGYYPLNFAIDRSGNVNVLGEYNKIALDKTTKNTDLLVYRYPIIGCTAQYWDAGTGICNNQPTAVDSDSIAINYFTDDAFFNTAGGIDMGIAANCARVPPDAYVNISNTQVFLVSNRFSLVQTTRAVVEQGSLSMNNLACEVKQSDGGTTGYQALVEGIDQLRFYYLESTSLSTKFVRSSNVTDWSNVIAVKVCLVARSMLKTKGAEAAYSSKNCDGNAVTYSDGISRETFSQIFSVKNHRANVRPTK